MVKSIKDQRIDVVYDRTFHMTLITSAACRQADVPRLSVIVSPPSLDFRTSRERFRFFKKRILSSAYQQPKCVTIAVSDEVASDTATFYRIPRDRVVVLPNPIDIELVRDLASAKHHRCDPNQTRIVIVGRLSYEKGHRLAFDALRIANDDAKNNICLEVVGDGPDRQSLTQYASQLGIAEAVKFHGFQDNPYPWIRNASLVCIASQYEGLPNVALETMAIGTGLVSTDCSGSLRSLIGENRRGVIVPRNDPRALAQVFSKFDSESDRWRKRCAEASVWVERNHAMEPWLDRMQSLLKLASKRTN
jgi:glycosyltransferase involved in cell wall biosynthesis